MPLTTVVQPAVPYESMQSVGLDSQGPVYVPHKSQLDATNSPAPASFTASICKAYGDELRQTSASMQCCTSDCASLPLQCSHCVMAGSACRPPLSNLFLTSV